VGGNDTADNVLTEEEKEEEEDLLAK